MGFTLDQLPARHQAQARQQLDQQTSARTPAPRASAPEEQLATQLQVLGFPAAERELRFHDSRRWRFDFAWPERRVACEVEGLTGGAGGRHQRIDGFEKDLEKYEAAMLDGWTVYRVSPTMIRKGRAVVVLARLLECESLLDQ